MLRGGARPAGAGRFRGGFATALLAASLALAGCPPTPDAGPDLPEPGEPDIGTPSVIGLDGSNSADPLNLPLFFAWTILEKPPGSAAAIANPVAPVTSFTADKPGFYFIQLRVTNTIGLSASDFLEVLAVGNRPPELEPFPDVPVPVYVGIGIDGEIHATDPDGDDLTFRVEPEGIPNFAIDENTGRVTFFPDESQIGASIALEIFVSDGEFEVSDGLTLSVRPLP